MEFAAADLQEIVRVAAAACQAISQSWCDATNAGGARGSGHQSGRQGRAAAGRVLVKLKEVTVQMLNDNAAKDPLVKKVHDSYMGFKKGWDKWAGVVGRRLSLANPRTD